MLVDLLLSLGFLDPGYVRNQHSDFTHERFTALVEGRPDRDATFTPLQTAL